MKRVGVRRIYVDRHESDYRLSVFDDRGRTVGTLEGWIEYDLKLRKVVSWIGWIEIETGERGKGQASVLVRRFERIAKKAGASVVHGEVKRNIEGFWKHLGYRFTGTVAGKRVYTKMLKGRE